MDLSFKNVVQGFCYWWLGSISVSVLIFIAVALVKLALILCRRKFRNSTAPENYMVDDVIDTVKEMNEHAGTNCLDPSRCRVMYIYKIRFRR